jgi:ribosomal protein L29
MTVAKEKMVTSKKAPAKGTKKVLANALVSVSEIYEALYSTKKELFALRLQQATSQLRQTHLLRLKRRECARLLSQLEHIKGSEVKVHAT